MNTFNFTAWLPKGGACAPSLDVMLAPADIPGLTAWLPKGSRATPNIDVTLTTRDLLVIWDVDVPPLEDAS